MTPELSILICSYKNPRLLELCVNSIRKNVLGIKYEIIVADNETQEETYDLMREKFPKIPFIPNQKNLGFGSMVRQCLKVAKGKFYFIINGDIIIKDDDLNKLLEYLKKHNDVGIVGPKLINFDNSIQNSCFRFYSPMTVVYRRTFLGRFDFAKKHLERFLMKEQRKSNKPIEADWVMGSAMMITKKAIDEVGTIDKRFFMYFEDVDWCWRFWEKGYKIIYNPEARVFHYHGKQSASRNVLNSMLFNKYSRIHILSALKFFVKHFGHPSPHKSSNPS